MRPEVNEPSPDAFGVFIRYTTLEDSDGTIYLSLPRAAGWMHVIQQHPRPHDDTDTQQDTSIEYREHEQNAVVSIDVDGLTRSYRLYIPSSEPNDPMPLLVAFHGGGGGEDVPFPQETRFNQLAESQGFVVAYPFEHLFPGNEGGWLLNTGPDRHEDIDFVEALIADVSSYTSIDTTRLYATGYSLGSMYTYDVACHLNHRFAAIASFAGTMPVNPNSCVLEDNVPIMPCMHRTPRSRITTNGIGRTGHKWAR